MEEINEVVGMIRSKNRKNGRNILMFLTKKFTE